MEQRILGTLIRISKETGETEEVTWEQAKSSLMRLTISQK